MQKIGWGAIELAFFALALFFFLPAPKSDPSPYTYDPAVYFVAGSMIVSRFCAYRSGRSLPVCIFETLIVVAMFLAHLLALNVATGHKPVLW